MNILLFNRGERECTTRLVEGFIHATSPSACSNIFMADLYARCASFCCIFWQMYTPSSSALDNPNWFYVFFWSHISHNTQHTNKNVFHTGAGAKTPTTYNSNRVRKIVWVWLCEHAHSLFCVEHHPSKTYIYIHGAGDERDERRTTTLLGA